MMHCLSRRSPSSPAEEHTHKYEETDNSIPAETEPAAAESWVILKHHRIGPSSKDGVASFCDVVLPSWPVFKQPHTQHILQCLLDWCFFFSFSTLCTPMIRNQNKALTARTVRFFRSRHSGKGELLPVMNCGTEWALSCFSKCTFPFIRRSACDQPCTPPPPPASVFSQPQELLHQSLAPQVY